MAWRIYQVLYYVDDVSVSDPTRFFLADAAGNPVFGASADGGLVVPAGPFLQTVNLAKSVAIVDDKTPATPSSRWTATPICSPATSSTSRASKPSAEDEPLGVQESPTPYYIKDPITAGRAFTFSATKNGAAITGANADAGQIVFLNTDRPAFEVAGLDLSGTIQVDGRVRRHLHRHVVPGREHGADRDLRPGGRPRSPRATSRATSRDDRLEQRLRGRHRHPDGPERRHRARLGLLARRPGPGRRRLPARRHQRRRHPHLRRRRHRQGPDHTHRHRRRHAFRRPTSRPTSPSTASSGAKPTQGDYQLQSFDAAIDIARPSRPTASTLLRRSRRLRAERRGQGHGGPDRPAAWTRWTWAARSSSRSATRRRTDSGDWQDDTARVTVSVTPGFLEWTKDGFHLGQDGSVKLSLNGEFNIKGFRIGAQNLTLEVQSQGSDGYLLINGTVTLPQLRGVTVQMGDGGEAGGLKIDLNTGQFTLDSWRHRAAHGSTSRRCRSTRSPSASARSRTNDCELLLAGTVEILGNGVQAKLDFEIKDGSSSSTTSASRSAASTPASPIGDTGAFLTDLGRRGGQHRPGQQGDRRRHRRPPSATRSRSATTEAALASVTVQGDFTTSPFTADVKGTLLLVGGVLGTVVAEAERGHHHRHASCSTSTASSSTRCWRATCAWS